MKRRSIPAEQLVLGQRVSWCGSLAEILAVGTLRGFRYQRSDGKVRKVLAWVRVQAVLKLSSGQVIDARLRPSDRMFPVVMNPARRCRVCGCTEGNCRQCINLTGYPCRWIAEDLCSACAPHLGEAAELVKAGAA